MKTSPDFTASRTIKVACIGDSITSGHKLDNPGRDAFPAQLQTMLGQPPHPHLDAPLRDEG